MNETPMEHTLDSFFGLMECFGTKKTEEPDFHPRNYHQLQKLKKQIKPYTPMYQPSYKNMWLCGIMLLSVIQE